MQGGAPAWELGSVDPGPVLGVARLLQISLGKEWSHRGSPVHAVLPTCPLFKLRSSKPSSGTTSLYPLLAS